ncbi:aspartate aminotransferase family protein [Salipaludibacillus sp. LMS25]|jgi:glutamate-1-semialdehyde 2,1-aminomutase|nr:aspartate aminotransferase family protein [Salipaludibacillus sp. LMS25]UTR15413.1 aspartate aminotransferase family protein [Salipaludibacillus sp. LMS25]
MAMNKIQSSLVSYGLETKGSRDYMKEAEKHLPGGVAANIKHFSPHPIVMEEGRGAWLKDIDGHWYVDYLMGYGALGLGHAHAKVRHAIADQIFRDGTCLFGTPHQLEAEFAKMIKRHFPSIQKLRYTNSGTEATQLAIRLAQVFTGKRKVAKCEGHYHGGYKDMLYSINPPLDEAGEMALPLPVPESADVKVDGNEPYILPFNHIEGIEHLITTYHRDLAAVILEPIQAGYIMADQAYIDRLRQLTLTYGIVLIFDEVKTGFRSALGGAQEKYGVEADLTTLGKVIGGGFPIGLVGGRSDILDVSSPSRGADVFEAGEKGKGSAKDILFHSGTYNGHPTILAVGLATINEMESSYAKVLDFTTSLRDGIDTLAQKRGLPVTTYGAGSIFNVIWKEDCKVRHYRDLQNTNTKMRKELDFALLQAGVYTKPLNRYSISAAHGKEELEFTLKAYEKAFHQLKEGAEIS